MKIQRSPNNPIIRPHMDDRMGDNVNGPSLIRVPDWVPDPLGRYYLYFAHHHGTYIRLAYADDLEGPYQVFSPGVLDLADSYFDHHIASPDVHVIKDHHEIWMYYHGCCLPTSPHQMQRVAISKDGIHFHAREELLGISYWRVFDWGGYRYALAMPGRFYRSRDGLTGFEEGPTLFAADMRHAAVRLRGDTLQIFYSNAGDCPESILLSTIKLTPDWMAWEHSDPATILQPETDLEGADLALVPSQRGAIHERACQLRDPCIYEEGNRTFLLYSVAGEHGIAIAEIKEED
jgi:hypothetical protein